MTCRWPTPGGGFQSSSYVTHPWPLVGFPSSPSDPLGSVIVRFLQIFWCSPPRVCPRLLPLTVYFWGDQLPLPPQMAHTGVFQTLVDSRLVLLATGLPFLPGRPTGTSDSIHPTQLHFSYTSNSSYTLCAQTAQHASPKLLPMPAVPLYDSYPSSPTWSLLWLKDPPRQAVGSRRALQPAAAPRWCPSSPQQSGLFHPKKTPRWPQRGRQSHWTVIAPLHIYLLHPCPELPKGRNHEFLAG